MADEKNTAPETPVTRSVVATRYKQKYAERGNPRGCGDWLQTVLAKHTLDDDNKLDVSALRSVAEANGVNAEYANRSPGWEGRMRMTIGLRLRPVVAAQGGLRLFRGKRGAIMAERAPEEWCRAHIR